MAAFFVTLAKKDCLFNRLLSLDVDKSTGVHSDQVRRLRGFYSRKRYPEKLHRIRFLDAEYNKCSIFLTHNSALPLATIAPLYRSRWRVDLLFKGIKQHRGIKTFYRTTPNALKTQIWISISACLLVAIVKHQLNVDASLDGILQIVSVTVCEKCLFYRHYPLSIITHRTRRTPNNSF